MHVCMFYPTHHYSPLQRDRAILECESELADLGLGSRATWDQILVDENDPIYVLVRQLRGGYDAPAVSLTVLLLSYYLTVLFSFTYCLILLLLPHSLTILLSYCLS
jgi:hypothetical protein